MRWAELALFLSPFLVYAAWRIAAARAEPRIAWSVVGAVAVLAVSTVIWGIARSLGPGEMYVPAHIEDGRIVPGHGVPAAR